ncbi:serine protease inhibitor swm-1-like [Branchiostoma lanceolatum]|uniref:serine protease inhibitor swm-1-like n=1 Tax=Branchiostoma lanceolatum TaxID=7740 RepID=UPI0034548F3D
MMMIWAAIILSVVVNVVSSQDCAAHSHWESCGSACPQTCDSISSPFQACLAVCVTGCECDAGYVLHNGDCIRHVDCPAKQCAANSHWSDCGSACPQTCEANQLFGCGAVCVPSCVCDDGFVSHYGACISPDQCPGGNPLLSGR